MVVVHRGVVIDVGPRLVTYAGTAVCVGASTVKVVERHLLHKSEVEADPDTRSGDAIDLATDEPGADKTCANAAPVAGACHVMESKVHVRSYRDRATLLAGLQTGPVTNKCASGSLEREVAVPLTRAPVE